MYTLGIVNRFVTQFNKTPELVEVDGLRAFIIITDKVNGKVKTKEFAAYLKDLEIFAPNTFDKINLYA